MDEWEEITHICSMAFVLWLIVIDYATVEAILVVDTCSTHTHTQSSTPIRELVIKVISCWLLFDLSFANPFGSCISALFANLLRSFFSFFDWHYFAFRFVTMKDAWIKCSHFSALNMRVINVEMFFRFQWILTALAYFTQLWRKLTRTNIFTSQTWCFRMQNKLQRYFKRMIRLLVYKESVGYFSKDIKYNSEDEVTSNDSIL